VLLYADADHLDSATNASYSEFWFIDELRVASGEVQFVR
jgi:hypothetical protein